MQGGDIILIKYNFDPLGWLIRKFTHSNWNHVALAINSKNVIEVKRNKGIVISNIKKYLDKDLYYIKILRLKNISLKEMSIIITTAMKIKENHKKHNRWWRSIFCILFKLNKQIDYTCSGFVAECYSKIDIYFSDKPIKYIIPEEINNHGEFINV